MLQFHHTIKHNVNFITALKKAYEILGRPLNLSNYNKGKNIATTNKENSTAVISKDSTIYSKTNAITNNKQVIIDYYNEKIKEAKMKGLDFIVAELEDLKLKEESTNYIIEFPYIDNEGRIIKIWENLEAILTVNNIDVVYSEICKNIEIYGLKSSNLNNCIVDIHSLCNRYGFRISIKQIGELITQIGMNNNVNPVREYIELCESTYKNENNNIEKLCECIITDKYFDKNLKRILITKWLINTARIVYNNEGKMNIEGVLTLQGSQGIGKTRFIKKIIPM